MLAEPNRQDFENLLAFRVALRRFQRWSEDQASAVGLTHVQHQLLVAIMKPILLMIDGAAIGVGTCGCGTASPRGPRDAQGTSRCGSVIPRTVRPIRPYVPDEPWFHASVSGC
jgi:hypothetical protein